MIVYLDADYKCHAAAEYGRIPFETDFFDGAAADYIEGFRCVPPGETWTREDGKVFTAGMIAPWRDSRELAAAQRAYEQTLLAESPTADEIADAIEEGVNSI